jgi:UDP:flavonoid glycosyltransferase YjiC (YdhE family)
MATILFTYEFGGGFGHINRLLAVAKRISDQHKLVFAIPDVTINRRILKGKLPGLIDIPEIVRWVPLPNPNVRTEPTHTFADVLQLHGYDVLEKLLAASLRRMDLLLRYSPDLIVADWSPTLRLVSQGKIPTVIVGNGYTVPPSGKPLQPIRPWANTVPASSRAHEAHLLAAVNEVRKQLSAPAVDFFADLFQGERTYVCTLAEFDPYARGRSARPVWPFNVPDPVTRPEGGEARNAVFCYLPNSHPALKTVLTALSMLQESSEVYIRDANPHAIARQCSSRIAVRTVPADFSTALPESRLLLHHAGLGTAYAGLAAGVPQLLLPVQLEHQITARGIQRFGASRQFDSPVSADTLKDAIAEMLYDPKYSSCALAAKRELNSRRTIDPVAEVAMACASFLN